MNLCFRWSSNKFVEFYIIHFFCFVLIKFTCIGVSSIIYIFNLILNHLSNSVIIFVLVIYFILIIVIDDVVIAAGACAVSISLSGAVADKLAGSNPAAQLLRYIPLTFETIKYGNFT